MKSKRIGKCYVCGDHLGLKTEELLVVQGFPFTWRHKRCQIGSPNWMKSKWAKRSEFTPCFLDTKEKGEKNEKSKIGYNRNHKQKPSFGPDPRQIERAIQERHRSYPKYETEHSHKIHTVRDHAKKSHRTKHKRKRR